MQRNQSSENMEKNPFVIKSYESKELFCDREKELQLMVRNCTNGADMTLISQRRMGKTGLILRLFDELRELEPDLKTIYVDIYASRSLADFIKLLAEASLRAFPKKDSMGEKILGFLKSLRPQFSFDPITGDPQLQINYQTEQEKEYTLRGLLDFLNNLGETYIAIDEFQQIREYPEQNMEALLRTYMQQMRHLHFIFCGSKRHIMADIFTNSRKPFYSSTSFITLGKISEESYAPFIRKLFEKGGRSITAEAIAFVLEWTRRHTYYTQQLCHTIFAEAWENIDVAEVKIACEQIMQMNEAVYLQYRQMLTDNQWNYLIAVAKEGSVSQVTAKNFLQKYRIGTPSVSKRLLQALYDKNLLSDHITRDEIVYRVDDVFMSHWLERL